MLSSIKSLRRKIQKAPSAPPEVKAVRIEGLEYNESPQFDRMIFICGLHRSGTTLLERLLATQFDVSYLRATVPESEGQFMQSVFSPAAKFGGPGRFAFSRAMQQELESLTDYDAYREQIVEEWSRFAVGTSPILLEKSPPHLTKIWWLRRVFPGSRFIVMSRDPRAVSGATIKWAKTSLPELMMHWNCAYSRALEDFDEQDCILTRYEDLMARPDEELDRIGSFLSLPSRAVSGEMETRHAELKKSKQKYFEHHEGTQYGRGVWEDLGYKV